MFLQNSRWFCAFVCLVRVKQRWNDRKRCLLSEVPCERWLSGIKMLEKCKLFLKSVQNSFGYTAKSPSNDKIPTNLNEALCQFIRQMLFTHATELVGTEIWSFCQHAQFYFAERRGLSWFTCWKSHHENAGENSTAYERLICAVYRYLHALEYQHINFTLEWYLLRCFYPRIKKFRKKFW